MQYKFFQIPALDPSLAETELNAFLRSHRVVTVDKQFSSSSSGGFWAFCVTYLADGVPKPPATGKGSIDYKDVLSPEEFGVYLDLKAKRKAIADEQGIAAFSVFSNAQLAAMIQNRARTLEDLRRISGIGASRLERFGSTFLESLRDAFFSSEVSPDATPDAD